MTEPCSSCGEQIPAGVRFCEYCGTWQGRNDSLRASQLATQEWAWREIEWVRSFRGSEFQARPLSPDPTAELTRSPLFRWREPSPPPETHAEARAAHEELVRLMVESDWEPVGSDGPWYAERFRRPFTPPPDTLPAARETGAELAVPGPSTDALPVTNVAPPAPANPEPPPVPEVAAASAGSAHEPQLAPMIVIEPARPFLARAGIALVTIVSVAIIIFALLVLAGHFRGGKHRARQGAAGAIQEGRQKPPFLTLYSR
jgi:zinc-ribbon domain